MPRPMRLDMLEAAIDEAIHDGLNAALTASLRAAADRGCSCSSTVIESFHARLRAELEHYERSWAEQQAGRFRRLARKAGRQAYALTDPVAFEDYASGRRHIPAFMMLALERLATRGA